MISQTNNSAINAAYQTQTKSNDTRAAKQNSDVAKSNEINKIEELKESINSGSYKVDIDALSEKIAESLL